ncbi:flagellar protein FliT [Saliterribacillus persicus]|uniref:Flagellar protein FliT n=1 Tax=Saliterribacillus persicus TaxID=930114 RepID=A0A368XJ81_9BACI|nr:flagellar protein FliT [Saliterribacillus persicus]RCW67088.1 flagellar protein FliT [Saliterribacillus persicus]
MDKILKLYKLTNSLIEEAEKATSSEDREEVIEKINTLLDEREVLLKEIKAPFSEEETKKGQEIIELDGRLQKMLAIIFFDLKKEMRSVKKQKSSNEKYVNPYQKLSGHDGMFMDSKN